MTEQENPPETPQAPDKPPAPARQSTARVILRVSLVTMALAVVGFTYFTPVWVDRGLTKISADRLRSIAEDTARQVAENDWTAEQGVDYATHQVKFGDLDTEVDISVGPATVVVRISGTIRSSNPFVRLTGGDPANHIEASYTLTK